MDMADWKGLAFRRRLESADRFNDCAMRRALCDLKMPGFRSSALLPLVTAPDHLRACGRLGLRAGARRRETALGVDFLLAMRELSSKVMHPLTGCLGFVSVFRQIDCGSR